MTTRRRVLHLTDEGDTSGYFQQLARFHDRDRFEVSFGTLRPTPGWLARSMALAGVTVHDCGASGRTSYPVALGRLVQLLRRERVDLIHTHLFDPSVVGQIAAVLARTPCRVMTRHYSDYHTRIDRPWHVRLDRLANSLAQAVIAVSQHTAAHLIEVEGTEAAKVHTVWNGIDFERVRVHDPAAPGRLREELAPGGEPLALIAGRLHPEKGYDHLLVAWPEVVSRLGRPATLLVAGTGPLRSHYEEVARASGCGDSVRFLGFRDDLPALMQAVDLFVLPSVAEAFGLVLAEALYLGTPVVASRVGGIPEIVDDGVDGLLVPPADPAALAAALVELLGQPEKRRALAGAGRAKVEARFGFDQMTRSYEAVYDTLFAARSTTDRA